MADDMTDDMYAAIKKLQQEKSLLYSQFENCHKEIRRLRDELMRYSASHDERSAHKVMTPEEYASLNLKGWHSVCHDIDGFGNVGIRYE